MPRLRFILNPHSGRNRRRPWLADRIGAWARARGLDADVVATERPHHATELAAAAIAEGCSRIVAVGGDGTMNEVASAVAGSAAELALVPCGSGNGLGRHLGIPGRLERALATAVDGRVRTIDTGLANDHPFFNAMGLGFDAEISRRFNRLARRGLVNYLRTGLAAFFSYRPERYTLGRNGDTEELDAFVVCVANSDQYGNDARIAPGARVDDGQLDLVAVRPAGPIAATALALRLFAGSFDRSSKVVRRTGPEFVVRRGAPGAIHVDGETRETGAEVVVRVRPGSLRIVVPQ